GLPLRDRFDEAVPHEAVHRRVHLADVERPGPPGPALELLLELVPVHRLLGEQRQHPVPNRHRAPSSAADLSRYPVTTKAWASGYSVTGRGQRPVTALTRMPRANALPRVAPAGGRCLEPVGDGGGDVQPRLAAGRRERPEVHRSPGHE